MNGRETDQVSIVLPVNRAHAHWYKTATSNQDVGNAFLLGWLAAGQAKLIVRNNITRKESEP